MAPAPWESIPPQQTKFVLVTGANGGIGLSICERLIDEYLATRETTAHLILIPTSRSVQKSQATVNFLRAYAKKSAETSEALRSRAGTGFTARDATRRVHILSVQLDLCNLRSVYKAADQLVHGTLSSPSDDDDFLSLVDVKIPRLDCVIFNAGNGNFTGLNWPLVAHNIFTRGIPQAVTWPTFKMAVSGETVDPDPEANGGKGSGERLGAVFCGNVFGHYLFGHALLPLLSRPAGSPVPPGRIVWESSIEPGSEDLSFDDFQGIKTKAPYESSKRITDLLALSSHLPASQPYVQDYLGVGRATRRSATAQPPKLYLVHPGVVHTKLFPLNAFLFFWYRVILYIARWLGSPWHPITTYKGAVAPAWLALQEQDALDDNEAELVKWGSSTTWGGEERVKKTEVGGWGWDGTVEDWKALQEEKGSGLLGKKVGRKYGAVDLTHEKRVEFEELGAKCWKEMERLRAEWEARLRPSVNGTPNGKSR
ncbi:hypothetical protein GQ53DRAFT_742827 [Thozetella sp. PMI_491]|nr:hypothetical protein GQ53DRAFT_742827 [Thozetella sp. PMI_491]